MTACDIWNPTHDPRYGPCSSECLCTYSRLCTTTLVCLLIVVEDSTFVRLHGIEFDSLTSRRGSEVGTEQGPPPQRTGATSQRTEATASNTTQSGQKDPTPSSPVPSGAPQPTREQLYKAIMGGRGCGSWK